MAKKKSGSKKSKTAAANHAGKARKDHVTEALTTTQLVRLARARLSPENWDFIIGGAETDTTTLRNRHAIDSIALRPRVLRNVEAADPSITFLGMRLRQPVLLAPLASLTDIDPAGSLPIAKAAAAAGTFILLSSVTGPDFETVAQSVPGLQFGLQFYPDGDEQWVLDLARRAADAGARALCMTVDVPTFGRRERILHRRQSIAGRPFGAQRVGESNRGRADWALVEKVMRASDLPFMLKGLQTAEDAQLAVAHGVDVLYVSNHGGRQLDHCRGAIDILPEIASAARGKAQLIVDGGFMRGTDILKGLARGAAVVGVGKLQALAYGAGGEAGVLRLLDILSTELTVNMKLLGVTSCAQLDGTFLQPAPPMLGAGPLSALPLLEV